MKQDITIEYLIKSAKAFCEHESKTDRPELYGITDGKAIGTFVEHLFQEYLNLKYNLSVGSSAKGLDLPSLNTDIKVTSIKQPQSSCPFSDSKQKIFGLGYNLILFVYEKSDNHTNKCGRLNYVSCVFIHKKRTADYQTTSGLLEILRNNGNVDDIYAFLNDRHIPGDDVTLINLAHNIINNPPLVGYITISNALQWRLQYNRIVNLTEPIDGISTIIRYETK
ncbi:MAG: restriction endonuclease [bacterium]